VYFGNYWQEDTNGDGVADTSDQKTPIKWRVLGETNNKVLLMAEQCLDAQPYNETRESVTWETCTLRTWLNEDFMNLAFTTQEQAAISKETIVTEGDPFCETTEAYSTTDKIFLPSKEDVMKTEFGFLCTERECDSRTTDNTVYCASKEGRLAVGEKDNYWLRNQGQLNIAACSVAVNGVIVYLAYVDHTSVGVRPMFYLDMAKVNIDSYDEETNTTYISLKDSVGSTTDEDSSSSTVTPYKKGDINGDGVVNGKDVNLLAQSCVAKVTLTDAQKEVADLDGDGKITGKDVNKLAQVCVGKATLN
jgi:hypothetical protein